MWVLVSLAFFRITTKYCFFSIKLSNINVFVSKWASTVFVDPCPGLNP